MLGLVVRFIINVSPFDSIAWSLGAFVRVVFFVVFGQYDLVGVDCVPRQGGGCLLALASRCAVSKIISAASQIRPADPFS